MEKERYCTCGNPRPMLLKSGQFGQFYSCDDWQCKQTQGTHEPQPPVGSVNNERPPPEPPPGMVLHSKKAGYEQRRAWHEKQGKPFSEQPSHLSLHLASK